MGLRGELNRLRAALRGQLSSFELSDGSRFWYSEEQAFRDLFMFGSECGKVSRVEDRPEPPPIVLALARAKDRRAALAALEPLPFWPYEYAAFVERGLLVHRSLIAGRDVNGEPCEDLSECCPLVRLAQPKNLSQTK